MTRFKRTLCAVMLTIGIASSAFAGNIGGMRTNSAGNIGGMRTNSAGNIGGMRTNAVGNIGGMRIRPTSPDAEFAMLGSIAAMIRLFLDTAPLF
jgi:hypothetical protein